MIIIAWWYLGLWMVSGLMLFIVIVFNVIRKKRALRKWHEVGEFRNRRKQ